MRLPHWNRSTLSLCSFPSSHSSCLMQPGHSLFLAPPSHWPCRLLCDDLFIIYLFSDIVSSWKAGIVLYFYLHLEHLGHSRHGVGTQGTFVKWITICLAASVSLRVMSDRVGLKMDLSYQIIALKSSILTISWKPFGKCNSHSLFRFQQSTTPCSLLPDYTESVFHKENGKMSQRQRCNAREITDKDQDSRRSRAQRLGPGGPGKKK